MKPYMLVYRDTEGVRHQKHYDSIELALVGYGELNSRFEFMNIKENEAVIIDATLIQYINLNAVYKALNL